MMRKFDTRIEEDVSHHAFRYKASSKINRIKKPLGPVDNIVKLRVRVRVKVKVKSQK